MKEASEFGRGYHVLLALLLFMFLIQSMAESSIAGLHLTRIGYTGILLGFVVAVARQQKTLILGLLFGVPGILLPNFLRKEQTNAVLTADGLSLVFFLVLSLVTLRQIFRTRRITGAAVSASLCVYLFLGLLWAFAYKIIYTLEPGSFQGLEAGENLEQKLFYFSFVTLTTLGYGDITPKATAAHSVAVLQALIGQIYLVVLVARFVSLHSQTPSET